MKKNEKLDDRINKYELTFDRNQLEDLRIEIIDNCSEITHYEKDSIILPLKESYLKIRKLKYNPIRLTESNDFYATGDPLYHLSYDEYKFPKIVYLIDKILKGDEDIELNYEEDKTIDDQIKELEERYNKVSNNDISNKKYLLNELNQLFEKKKLNKNQKSCEEYYLKLQEVIHLKLIDSIKIDEISNALEFFENSSNKTMKRILHKESSIKK